MKTAIGILLLLIPFLIFFIVMVKATGFWDTVLTILGAVVVSGMIITGIALLTGK